MSNGDESGTPPVFTDNDDRFHFDSVSDQWWETETSWFSFHEPSRRLGGWLYTLVRPNIGTVAGGAWVWDDTAWLPWDVAYSANYSALRLPADSDLRDIVLPTGVSIRVVEPTLAYELGYDDGDRLHAELRFQGVMAPEPLTAVGSTFGSGQHFDQFGRVRGHLVLHGERIDIDCFAMRDRTWGPRPEHRPRRAAYVTGAAGADHGFLAVTNWRSDHDPIAYGFLRRDGQTVSLTRGSGGWNAIRNRAGSPGSPSTPSMPPGVVCWPWASRSAGCSSTGTRSLTSTASSVGMSAARRHGERTRICGRSTPSPPSGPPTGSPPGSRRAASPEHSAAGELSERFR